MAKTIMSIFDTVDSVLYYPILMIILIVAGLIFSILTGFIQIRGIPDMFRSLMERPNKEGAVSSFQALMVSTASRVGTGNIIGVSTAICLGGPGAAFWMWLLAIIGGASAFIESTLAQIYKKRDEDGGSYGGPAYYIEAALHKKWVSVLFVIALIATYAVGFNLLCSYNLQSTFKIYGFYDDKTTPWIIGAVLAIIVGWCLLGGGKRIVKITGVIVPFMGICYVAVSLIVIIANIKNLPGVFVAIFQDAFNFKAIFSGVAGSCLIYGIKRGLYSNEAGIGSAPNAAASADVSHPVKQGLIQTLSVYIDTILLCTATAMMCMTSGVEASEEVSGAVYVQEATRTVFGSAGPLFITFAMVLFAFTTLIGNLYYVDNGIAYLNGKKMPGKSAMLVIHILCALIVFVGAGMSMGAAWAAADITMGLMAIINIPCCLFMSGTAIAALKDYQKQKAEGKNPVFHAKDIGLDDTELDFWK